MKAEIISVGTELLLGNVANIDAKDVSEALSELGIDVFFHTVVGDNEERLRSALEIAEKRADIIITTGGLGPTYDDLTKQTLADHFGRKLIFHEEVAESIRAFFRELRHAEMTENNLAQAMLPEGCTIFRNSCGTAPGCGFLSRGKHVLMLPGPPRECLAMLKSGVVPYLTALSDSVIRSHTIRVYGLGESAVEQRLRPLMLRMRNPTLAPYAATAEMSLRLTAKAHSAEECERMMEPYLEKLLALLGDKAYGTDVSSLEEVCVRALTASGRTFACAESCTGGLLAKRITDISGASAAFVGGSVTYTAAAKRLLGVPAETIERYGVVSAETAAAMAKAARGYYGADYAAGITGLAGPDGDGSDVPVGTVFVALADENRVYLRRLSLAKFDRDRVRLVAASEALDLLRRVCIGLDPNSEVFEG